jgi:5'-3' exonuclease
MKCDLIIDGNYILSRLVFSLHKNNLLYGALESSLDNAIKKYSRWYPFDNIYLVSDSKEKSWRKKFLNEYKAKRIKDNKIDWKFAYETYGVFKENINGKRVKVLESPHIEGDDWISYLVDDSNNEGRSTIIITNDYDIRQLIKYSLEPLYINIMTNEMYGKEKLFLPPDYQLFKNELDKLKNDNIFEMNYNTEFSFMFKKFLTKYDIHIEDPVKSLFVKLVMGDKSDNISSIWREKNNNGKYRNIGKAGAATFYKKYLEEFGDVNFDDPDFEENIADLVCEKKKLSKTNIPKIVDNIKFNTKLIDLSIDNLPEKVVERMKKVHKEI